MHSLLSEFTDRFFRRPADGRKSEPQGIARLAEENIANSSLPSDHILCAFNEERLVNYYRDLAPADKPADERWWLIPCADLPVTLTVQIDQEMMEVDITVRLEAETELLGLLGDRAVLTVEDLVPLLEVQLSALTDTPEEEDTQRLVDLGRLERERLRARYSLRLQKKGLRCTDISRFELLLPAAGTDLLSVSNLQETATEEDELHPLQARQQLQEILAEANGHVRQYVNKLLWVYVIVGLLALTWPLANQGFGWDGFRDALASLMAFLVVMVFVRLAISPSRKYDEAYIKNLRQLANQAGISFHRLRTLVARDYRDLDGTIDWDR